MHQHYIAYDADHRIIGIGTTRKAALADAEQWLGNADDRHLLTCPATERLALALLAGSTDAWNLDIKLADLPEETPFEEDEHQ